MKKRWIVTIAVAVIIVGGIAWQVTRPPAPPRTATTARQDVIQDVIVTGNITPKQTVDLSFDISGTILENLVAEGEEVSAGDTLAKLDPATVNLELSKARADLLSAQEDARIALESARNSESKTKDNSEKTRLTKRQAVIDAKAEMDQAKTVWDESKETNGVDSAAAETTRLTYVKAQSVYNAAQKALSETLASIDKTNQAATDATTAAAATYDATRQAATNASGPSSLAATRALATLRVQKSTLKSPISGTVTSINYEVGEYASAGQAVVTVATVGELELMAHMPESDAIKVRPDMSASVTFDALAKEEITAKVTDVAPAAKVIEGVPTYKVTLSPDSIPESAKPGLTVNITVHAAEKKGVLAIPRRAVITSGDRTYVRVLQDSGEITEADVTTGLFGSHGLAQITSGLSEGEEVVIETDG